MSKDIKHIQAPLKPMTCGQLYYIIHLLLSFLLNVWLYSQVYPNIHDCDDISILQTNMFLQMFQKLEKLLELHSQVYPNIHDCNSISILHKRIVPKKSALDTGSP